MGVGNIGVAVCGVVLDVRDDDMIIGNIITGDKTSHIFVYCKLRLKMKDQQRPSFKRQNARRRPVGFQRPADDRRLVALRAFRLPHCLASFL